MKLKSVLGQPALVAVLLSLGLASPALSRGSVKVTNCENSHYELLVTSGSSKAEADIGEYGDKSIEPGHSKSIKCGGCYLMFTNNGGKALYKKGHDGDHYYIHIKKNWSFSETTDGHNCD